MADDERDVAVSVERARWVARTMVELADTLSADFDADALLGRVVERCCELLGAAAAGIVLADDAGRLRVVAASSDQSRLLELLEVQDDEGPCLDAFHLGAALRNVPLDGSRWARFSASARADGYLLVNALPLRHAGVTIGALNVFHTSDVPVPDDDLDVAQSLVDIATISVLHGRALEEASTRAAQLQQALHSRVAIEQAKGVVAERLASDVDGAFDLLRSHARRRNLRLVDVARHVVEGSLAPEALEGHVRRRPESAATGEPAAEG